MDKSEEKEMTKSKAVTRSVDMTAGCYYRDMFGEICFVVSNELFGFCYHYIDGGVWNTKLFLSLHGDLYAELVPKNQIKVPCPADIRCECGAEKCGTQIHSEWCPKG